MSSVSATMRKENAWPTKVLTLSTNSSSFCMAEPPTLTRRLHGHPKKTPSGLAGWCFARYARSGLLRGGLGRGLESLVVGHSGGHQGIRLPLDRPFGERPVRCVHFLAQRNLLPTLSV